MTDKELHRLSREDLLRLLVAQSKDVIRLQEELDAIRVERDRIKDDLECMEKELGEKDEEILRLNSKLNEKAYLLGQKAYSQPAAQQVAAPGSKAEMYTLDTLSAASPLVLATPVNGKVQEESIGKIEQALENMDRKLEAMSRLLKDSDDETRHLRAVLFAMIS